jgi:membrane protein DedA with SNARE-associated domain
MAIGGVIAAAWAGTIAGGAGGYWVGRYGGLTVIRRFGHWFGMSEARLEHARVFFERHGVKTVIIARFIAILRMVAGVLAGVTQMPFGVFSLCNAIGGLLWSVTFGALGYIFGQNLPRLEHYVRGGSVGVLAGIAAVLVVLWIWRRRRRDSTTFF